MMLSSTALDVPGKPRAEVKELWGPDDVFSILLDPSPHLRGLR
jgi:hypothetical protein